MPVVSTLIFLSIFGMVGGFLMSVYGLDIHIVEHATKGTLVVYLLLSSLVYFENKKRDIFEDNSPVYVFMIGPVVGWYMMQITGNLAWFGFAAIGSMGYILAEYALIPLFPKGRFGP